MFGLPFQPAIRSRLLSRKHVRLKDAKDYAQGTTNRIKDRQTGLFNMLAPCLR